jgi:uncharacterized membrane protein YdfJ with MMPL/SSD domain
MAAILLAVMVGTLNISQAQNSTASATQPAQQTAPTSPNTAGNAASNPAQQPSSDPQHNGAYTITTVVNEVNLIFTVTDKHGHFIRDLN